MPNIELDPIPQDPKGWQPWLVALVRAIAYAVILAILDALIVGLGGVTSGAFAIYVPFVIGGIRQLEGVIDQKRGQKVQRPLGSGPA